MDGNENQEPDCPGCRKLSERVEQLEQMVRKLEQALEASQRAGKRQAAPFRKPKKAEAKKPGRKPGEDYGTQARRTIPEQIDERYDAPLPECCPHCGSDDMTEEDVRQQYQTDIPRRPIYRQFDVHLGQCNCCGQRVQGRHELQTSDSLGAAASQFGPDLQAALTVCNKELGLSHGKGRTLLSRLFGISISRSTNCRAQARLAEKLKPTHKLIGKRVRGSPFVVCDETGWRVNGQNAWLHDFVTDKLTYYHVDPTRSGDPARQLLGEDYSGVLIHDGWSVYNSFPSARHQQCLAHLIRRCESLLETAVGGAVRFPRAVLELFSRAFAARGRHARGEIGDHGLRVIGGRLTEAMCRLVTPVKMHTGNERLAAHLEKHVKSLFTFLSLPGLDATNWRAEQAIRPAVVNRKVWGGNRTWRGAHIQSILTTTLVTCHQQAIDVINFLKKNLTAPHPVLLPLSGR